MVVAVCGIVYSLVYLIKHNIHRGLVMNVALILAGAVGNIIDSTFYGIMYKYAPLFHGVWLICFYFPLFRGTYPSWLPFFGGEPFEFSARYLTLPIRLYAWALS